MEKDRYAHSDTVTFKGHWNMKPLKVWLVESQDTPERHLFKNSKDAWVFIGETYQHPGQYEISEVEVIE